MSSVSAAGIGASLNGHVLYPAMDERLGIAGSGTIACGLAATASRCCEVLLWARSDESAARAQAAIEKDCRRLDDADPGQRTVMGILGGGWRGHLIQRLGALLAEDGA